MDDVRKLLAFLVSQVEQREAVPDTTGRTSEDEPVMETQKLHFKKEEEKKMFIQNKMQQRSNNADYIYRKPEGGIHL